MENLTKEQLRVIEAYYSTPFGLKRFKNYLKSNGLIEEDVKKFVPGWYKSSQSEKYMMYWPSVAGPIYGLSISGQWYNFPSITENVDEFSYHNHLELMEKSAVRSVLIGYASMYRGKRSVGLEKRSEVEVFDSSYRIEVFFDPGESISVWFQKKGSGVCVMRDGVWDDIVEKEEKVAEKSTAKSSEKNVAETFDNLITLVQGWSIEKGINTAAPEKQFLKVIEEAGEIAGCLAKKKPREELMDAVGDTFVTLIILSQQLGLDPKDCLQMAYNVISKRTGKQVDGVFVKEEDLK